MNKIKKFFINLIPTKRKIIQLYSALLFNANIKGFITGDIFQGVSKSACVPGLNCYSCPGAIGACPLGSLQNALSESKTKFPTYVLGIILLYSIILGRTICGFLCPFGLIQELFYKIKTPKLKKNKVTRVLSYFKYVLLVVLVIILPLVYALQKLNIPLPAFCKYICPAGTFEGAIFLLGNPNNSDFYGMLGPLFTWKFILLIGFIVASVFIFRFFCRFFCPLGALYGLFNKLSILGIKVDKSKCNHCQACVTNCKMDVKEVGDHECIQCGDCRNVCKCNAIDWKLIRKVVKEELNEEENNITEDNEVSVSQKKDFRIKKKTFNIIVGTLSLILLVVVLISVNFKKEKLDINDTVEELNISLLNEVTFDIKENDKATLLYFYETLTIEEVEVLKTYSDKDRLNIILISKYDNEINNEISGVLKLSDSKEKVTITRKFVKELEQLNILFATDNEKNEIILSFKEDDNYPYTVFLDFEDKILIKKDKFISTTDLESIVVPVTRGDVVGNKVGNICVNKEINLVGSNEKFSVSENIGKIVVINFWYTSCTPCVKELPFFDKVYKKYSDDTVFIAIHEASMYDEEKTIDFINNQFSDFEILFGYDDEKETYYSMLGGKSAWPTTVIVDKEGRISFVKHGSLTEEDLEKEIVKLIH